MKKKVDPIKEEDDDDFAFDEQLDIKSNHSK